MNFFENTRKPQGFGGKLMTKMMNIGHAKLSQWGFSKNQRKWERLSARGKNDKEKPLLHGLLASM